MFKKLVLLGLIALGIFSYTKLSHQPVNEKIAITQIAPHPSLDKIRQGIIDTLKAQGIKESNIIFQDAQGSIAIAAQIAKKFISIKPKLIITITTPSTQTMYPGALSENIPLIFTGVSAPKAAKLQNDNNSNAPGVTGIQDIPPFEKQVKLIKDILPASKKRIGILYNPGEINAVFLSEHMKKALELEGFSVILGTASSTLEVSQATLRLTDKVDAIYLPNDNTIISALDAVLKVTTTHQIPVFSSDIESVEKGCVAAIAPDQYEMGAQTAQMAMRVLKGEKLENIRVEQSKKVIEKINHTALRHTGLSVPQPSTN